MENVKEKPGLLDLLIERTVAYGRTSYELFQLTGLEKTSGMVSSLVPRLCVFMVFLMFFMIVNIGLALWLGEVLGKSYYGFFVVGGFLAGVVVVLLFMHERIKRIVSDTIIKEALN